MGPRRPFGNDGRANNSRPSDWGQTGRTMGDARTPAWNTSSRTPAWNASSRTPAWNASSRTPNPYLDSGRTPAWNASSRTPNPYLDSGRTPAWNAGSRTPNPYTTGAGGTWGGATPARAMDGATPAHHRESEWGAGAWGGTDDAWPATAPTPAIASAPTPAAAPTPGPSGWDALGPKTPAGYQMHRGADVASAPTPAFSAGTYPGASKAREGQMSCLLWVKLWLLTIFIMQSCRILGCWILSA